MRDEHQTSVGSLVAGLREERGWSQRALAKWVGMDQSALSRIEAGHRRVTADELHRLAQALGVSTDALLGAGDAITSPAAASAHPRWRLAMSSAPVSQAMIDGYSPDEVRSREGLEKDVAPAAPAAFSFAALPDAVEQHADVLAERAGAALSPPVTAARAARVPPASRPGRPQGVVHLPEEVASVITDWVALRDLVGEGRFATALSVGHSAEGKPAVAGPERRWGMAATAQRDVLYDRVARFWRAELQVDAAGPLPDLVSLLEDGLSIQVVVARVASDDDPRRSAETPVCAALTQDGVPFVFVNAARPVVLQRYALAHAFAHIALGHGDIVDRRIEWSRKNPTEAAANDFAEELLAPVGAVSRWYAVHGEPEPDLDTLLQLGNALGISAWSALYRSRAAGRVKAKPFALLANRLRRHEWELLPRQAFLGGLRDTLSSLTPAEVRPPGEFGPPRVLRLPAAMRRRALRGLRDGRLSLERAAGLLRLSPVELTAELKTLGIE